MSGRYVPLAQTLQDFEKLVSGECDDIPEQAFYMVGTLEEVYAKAKSL